MIGRRFGRSSRSVSFPGVALLCAALAFGLVQPSRADTPLYVHSAKEALPLSLDLRLGEQRVFEAWNDAFDALGQFFDRDGDGELDREEATRLPSPFSLRQTLWGHFALEFDIGRTPLKVEAGARASFTDLADHYRKHGVGDAVVATGQVVATKQLNAELVRHLDVDGDGAISVGELRDAATKLAPLDLNDDELIGPGELARGVTSYPGTQGTTLVAAKPRPGAPVGLAPVYALPVAVPEEHRVEYHGYKSTVITLPLVEPASDQAKRAAAQTAWESYSIAGLTLHLRPERGVLPARIAEIQLAADAWFLKYDDDRDDVVTSAEAEGLQRATFERYLAVADRDGDKRLSRDEYRAWFELQTRIAAVQTLVTAIDFERSLFEQLDADHDGGLSRRDLRTAPERLEKAGVLVDGKLDLARVPRTILATVSRGHPTSLLRIGARTGPSWFQAMDRNGDGEVSERESLLPGETFQKLDADRDGVLSADEAVKTERTTANADGK